MSFASAYIIYSLCGSGIYDRLTGITPLAHHGMIFVPFGIRFAYSNEFGNVKEVKGGSPYGAGTYARREGPTSIELMHAFDHGYYFANITKQLKEATA